MVPARLSQIVDRDRKPIPCRSAFGAVDFRLALALLVLQAAYPLCGAEAPTTPPELVPCRVRVDVAFGVHPEIDAAFRTRTLGELREGLERSVGGMWQCTVRESGLARPAGRDPLSRIRPEQLARNEGAADLDKLFLLSVESAGGGYRVAGREWDTATSQLGLMQERLLADRREVAMRLVLLLRALFRPVAMVTQARNGPLLLRARGGALTPHDENWQPLRDGGVFEAYYRYYNKEGAIERIQPVPWTYLSVQKIERGAAEAIVTSGLRSPFSARRRRIDVVALEVTRQSSATRLTLVTLPPGRRPLGGVEVEVSAEKHPAPGDKGEPSPPRPAPRVTDRNGQVMIPAADADAPLAPVWLIVRSGQNLLAHVPFVPGIRDADTLELPDDALRLEVEGQVAQLQSELVDTVARRAVVAALVRKRAKERNWTEVDATLRQLASMPKAPVFAADLSAIRLNALRVARARKDKLTELRIQKLCDATAVLIKDYLDEDKLRELREEIAELKQVAAEDAAAEAELKSPKSPVEAPAAAPAAGTDSAPPAKPKPAF